MQRSYVSEIVASAVFRPSYLQRNGAAERRPEDFDIIGAEALASSRTRPTNVKNLLYHEIIWGGRCSVKRKVSERHQRRLMVLVC
jgi:hypothetical protein